MSRGGDMNFILDVFAVVLLVVGVILADNKLIKYRVPGILLVIAAIELLFGPEKGTQKLKTFFLVALCLIAGYLSAKIVWRYSDKHRSRAAEITAWAILNVGVLIAALVATPPLIAGIIFILSVPISAWACKKHLNERNDLRSFSQKNLLVQRTE